MLSHCGFSRNLQFVNCFAGQEEMTGEEDRCLHHVCTECFELKCIVQECLLSNPNRIKKNNSGLAYLLCSVCDVVFICVSYSSYIMYQKFSRCDQFASKLWLYFHLC